MHSTDAPRMRRKFCFVSRLVCVQSFTSQVRLRPLSSRFLLIRFFVCLRSCRGDVYVAFADMMSAATKRGHVTDSDDDLAPASKKSARHDAHLEELENENIDYERRIKELKEKVKMKENGGTHNTSMSREEARQEKLRTEIDLLKKEAKQLTKEVEAAERVIREKEDLITECTDRECKRLAEAYKSSEEVVRTMNEVKRDMDRLIMILETGACRWKDESVQVDPEDLARNPKTPYEMAHERKMLSDLERAGRAVLKQENLMNIDQRVLTSFLNKREAEKNVKAEVKQEKVKKEYAKEVKLEPMEFDVPSGWQNVEIKAEKKTDDEVDDDVISESEPDE